MALRKHLRLRDWPFGALARRLLVEALLDDDQPAKGWTKHALEDRAEAGPGGIDEVLAGALQLRLIEQRGARWHRPDDLPMIADPLVQLIRAVAELPDEEIAPLPRRTYHRR